MGSKNDRHSNNRRSNYRLIANDHCQANDHCPANDHNKVQISSEEKSCRSQLLSGEENQDLSTADDRRFANYACSSDNDTQTDSSSDDYSGDHDGSNFGSGTFEEDPSTETSSFFTTCQFRLHQKSRWLLRRSEKQMQFDLLRLRRRFGSSNAMRQRNW